MGWFTGLGMSGAAGRVRATIGAMRLGMDAKAREDEMMHEARALDADEVGQRADVRARERAAKAEAAEAERDAG